ncbi:hypothetical protein FOI68_22605 [Brevibacillus sp. LEMMJ03]|uniref:hypothetical protein n=1 Tax=Brevibacillus sp. LEMMJ03 TaxID=2595056 RepID=UPI00117E9C19|nr:hypothetical protein [Brevibacillus sp. LEMMJ03]MCG6199576.1 hypothetical protein [Anoxybacillus sp. LAT_38]TRY22278.1 hypothetical protein FOI68_22605 [Brevibacillus sp. LEMMJ03]
MVTLDKFVKNEQMLYQDLNATLPLQCYAHQIYTFSVEAKKLFEGKEVNYKGWEFFDGQYNAFWSEYEELLIELNTLLNCRHPEK